MKDHRIAFLIIIGVLPFILWSCVDVNNANIPSNINYHSLARFVNLSGDNPAAGAITVDNSPVGTVTFGNTTAYINLLAGSRRLGYSGTTQLVNFNTDDQYTVIVHSLNGAGRFLILDEGYSFKNNSIGKPDTTQIRFVNSAVGFAPTLIFKQDSLTGSTVADAVPFGKGPDYTILTSGKYIFFVISNGGYLATITGAQSVPPVTTASEGSGTFGVSFDNGVTYSIQIQSDNSPGIDGALYTSAGLYLGAIGVKGPLEYSIDVSSQTVGFPGAPLVPVDTVTKASGSTSAMTLTANAALDSFQLQYTISVTADPTDTPQVLSTFVNAEFHVGSINGPVVRGIATGPFRDTTITDVWASSDIQPLTRALVDSLLKGSIYIAFRTQRNITGELTLRLHPDQTSTNTYTGSWGDISEALKDSIVAGRMYVKFSTIADTGGQIRGQLKVDTTAGNYGVASLDSSTYSAGALYTVVAVDSGSTTLKLFGLANRQPVTAITNKLPGPQKIGKQSSKK
jgi:hypothetical protein